MLKQRVMSGVVGAPVVLALAWLGGWPLCFLVGAISVVGVWELLQLFAQRGVRSGALVPLAASGALVVSAMHGDFVIQMLVLAMVPVVAMGVEVFRDSKDLGAPLVTVFSAVYVPFLLSFMLRIRAVSAGYALLLVLCTWATDTGAYFVGTKLGRHRVLPNISPKKSVEGAVGGFAASIVTAVLVAQAMGTNAKLGMALLGVVIAIGAELGDLAESAIKRFCGAKDSGHLIPGHGGVLDRFDSMIFAAPVAYIVLRLLMAHSAM